MTDEEIEISRSTPIARFDAPPPSPSGDEAAAEAPPAAPEYALELLDRAVNDSDNPVTLFALEWCEFCWSVRKLFARYGIPYQSFDLDSVAYQENNRGGDIRAALYQRTGQKTIPQIYVGGRHIGGATETFDAIRSGSLQKLLEERSVQWNRSVNDDPYTFLPGWLHKR